MTNGEAVMFCQEPERWPVLFSRQCHWFSCRAVTFNRAHVAFGPDCADDCAQIHQGGFIRARGSIWDKRGGPGPEHFASRTRIDRQLKIDHARQQSRDVRLDDWHSLVEREGGDRAGGITSNPGKSLDRIQSARKPATMFFHHGDGSRTEITCARVIAEALPGVKDLLFGSSRQGGEIGETLHPLIIIWEDGGDLRLLEHELGDQDGIGIAGAAPGKIAAVSAVPGAERAPE